MITRLLMTLSSSILLSGCLSVNGGEGGVEMDGLVNGYISTAALRPYDGDLISIGVLDDTHEDELVSVELWPLVGFGVGVAGARLRILPLEFAIGTLFYDPDMPRYSWDEEEDEVLEPLQQRERPQPEQPSEPERRTEAERQPEVPRDRVEPDPVAPRRVIDT